MMEHGIEAQVSWIMGDDCQTKENIEEDIQDLIEFNACTVQLTTLLAFPGTPLYKRVKAEGRIPPTNPEEFHLFGNTMESLHFTHEERLKLIFSTYDRIYCEQGPSAMKTLDVYLNGYEYLFEIQESTAERPQARVLQKENPVFDLFRSSGRRICSWRDRKESDRGHPQPLCFIVRPVPEKPALPGGQGLETGGAGNVQARP